MKSVWPQRGGTFVLEEAALPVSAHVRTVRAHHYAYGVCLSRGMRYGKLPEVGQVARGGAMTRAGP